MIVADRMSNTHSIHHDHEIEGISAPRGAEPLGFHQPWIMAKANEDVRGGFDETRGSADEAVWLAAWWPAEGVDVAGGQAPRPPWPALGCFAREQAGHFQTRAGIRRAPRRASRSG
jgi:hypothetical protein